MDFDSFNITATRAFADLQASSARNEAMLKDILDLLRGDSGDTVTLKIPRSLLHEMLKADEAPAAG